MEIQKSQFLRMYDVIFLAPVLVLISTNKKLPVAARVFLFTEGVLIALYNGINYVENKKLEAAGKLTPLNFRQELRHT